MNGGCWVTVLLGDCVALCRKEGKDFDPSQIMASVFDGIVQLEQPRSSTDAVTAEDGGDGQTKKKKRWWLGLR